jgi:hypothetical protein
MTFTKKEKNDLKGYIVIFVPMITIPILLGFCGFFNIGTVFFGAAMGILCGHLSLLTGFVKNRV